MNASDTGLCALEHHHQRVLVYAFSDKERALISEFHTNHTNEFDINYRELLSCAFAVHTWAQTWRAEHGTHSRKIPIHVHFRLDNTSVVAWQTKMTSNTRAQTIIRLLGYWEVAYGLQFSSSHIAGTTNAIADVGSRLSNDTQALTTFTNLTTGWTQIRPTLTTQILEQIWQRICENTPWQIRPEFNTFPISSSSDFNKGYGSGRPIRSTSITNVLMGILHFFMANGRQYPWDHPQIRMLLKDINRLDSLPQRKAPVSIQLLETCFASLNLALPSDQALWGRGRILCLAFFFLLRRSEIASLSKGRFRWFALKVTDIAVLDHQGNATLDANAATVHIRLRGSKTNQNGQVTPRMQMRSGHRRLCPVLGALLLLRAHGNLLMHLPAATYPSNCGSIQTTSARRVATTVQEAARRNGSDSGAYSTHSLRSGGATHMYCSGVDALTIQFDGRWASDTFKIYTRLCQESVSSVASRMVSGSRSSTTLQ